MTADNAALTATPMCCEYRSTCCSLY